MFKNCSECQTQFLFSPCSELGIFMYSTCNSMNNLSSYCGLVDAKKKSFRQRFTCTEPPTITLCFDPRFKPSVFEKYNITNWIFFDDYFPKVLENKTIKASGHF